MTKSKNEQAWETLFKEENIVEQIEQDGVFYISSARINQQREARLMAKFDHASQLPQIFTRNKLSILPVSRGGYVIGHFDTYFNLPKKHSDQIIYLDLPEHIETLNAQNIYSESSAILCAFHSGMISDVVGEDVDITVFSRMSTGIFSYEIRDLEVSKNHSIKVENSQCEIDGGFEGEQAFVIIEAKCESVKDFLIRQLYYPYRLWKSKIDKNVIPIFLSISNDIFTFYKFCFTDFNNYNSLELISESRYCLGANNIEIDDIRNILNNIVIISEPKEIPLPQADTFPRIVDLLGRLYQAEQPLTKDEVTAIYAFSVRQTDYYVAAAIYLGLVDKERIKNKVIYCLSPQGKSIIMQHPRERNLKLVKSILCHRIFNSSLHIYLKKAEIPSIKEIITMMEEGTEKIAQDSVTVRKRRAQTVRGWISWILELTRI